MTYDAEAWDSKVIHFSGDCHDSRGEGSKNRRPLIHFYAFMMHADALVDARVKRFARDRLRYRDSIFCKASQVGFVRSPVGGRFGSFPFLLLRRAFGFVFFCARVHACAGKRSKKLSWLRPSTCLLMCTWWRYRTITLFAIRINSR